MNDSFATMRSRSVTAIVVALTLVILCFSVGVGLRLRRFPSQRVQLDSEPATSIDRTSQLPVFAPGPLNVPTQPQKRSKRFVMYLTAPISVPAVDLFTLQYPASECQPTILASILFVAFPSDRAPPFTS
jgi:hypothetical protein